MQTSALYANIRHSKPFSLPITCFPTERANPTERATLQHHAYHRTNTEMPRQRKAQPAYNEGTLLLAIQAANEESLDSKRQICRSFTVPRRTLDRRRDGTLSRHDCEPNSKKLSKLEEEAIVARILELDTRGIGATRTMVEEMANDLLAARSKGPVGKH